MPLTVLVYSHKGESISVDEYTSQNKKIYFVLDEYFFYFWRCTHQQKNLYLYERDSAVEAQI